jgi:outer membrane protein assembly factor BamB
VLSIRTTATCATAALALVLALDLPAATAGAQPPPDGRFAVTPRASVVLEAAPFGPPAIGRGLVFLASETGRLAAHRLSDGAERWRIDIALEQPPVAQADLVFVVADRTVQARHAADGRELWRVPTAALAAPLLAHEGWVILAPAGRLVALRAVDGSVVWSRENPTLVAGPTIEGNRLYAPLADGRVQALDLRTGAPVWVRRLGGPPTSVLAFPDRIYAGSDDKRFYCMDALTGRILWNAPVGAALRGAPAAHGDLVYTVALDNLVRAHDRRNGHRIWNQSIGYRALSGPTLAGGLLAVAGPSAQLQIFDAVTGQPQPALAFDAPLVAPLAIAAVGHEIVMAAVTGSLEAGWRLLLFDSSYRVPLAPLTALPGETLPLWTPGKQPLRPPRAPSAPGARRLPRSGPRSAPRTPGAGRCGRHR